MSLAGRRLWPGVARDYGPAGRTRWPYAIMQVDWAGDTASVIDTDTGEVIPAYVFVATLPYSGYSYCDTAIVAEEGREIECAAEQIPMNAKIPNRRSGWGSVLDIEIYLNFTEPMHPAQG